MWKQAVKKKFASVRNNKKKNPKKHKIVKKLIALSLLPPGQVQETFYEIKLEALSEFGFDSKSVNNFFDYYETEWFVNVKIENFNYYKEFERTNNKVESYHNNLGTVLGKKPHILNFLGNF